MGRNEILPRKTVCILERSPSDQIQATDFPKAFGDLMQQLYRTDDSAILKKTLKLTGRLGLVSLYRLRCSKEKEAAWISCREMIR